MMHAEDFWAFVNERESIRLRRAAGAPREEWTQDWIFREFSFTNIKREHDRTSMLLKREFYNVYAMNCNSKVALLNAVIFRYFGSIYFARVLGWHHTFDDAAAKRMVDLAVAHRTMGNVIYTPAYVVRPDFSGRPKHEFLAENIAAIWANAENILDTDKWEVACQRMCTHYGIGTFMSKEFLLDYILATWWQPSDWETWTPVGPGGRLGAGVVLNGTMKQVPDHIALTVCRALYAQRHDKWKHDVLLDLTDIQFQLCEFSKYMKAKMRIGQPKRKFNPTEDDITRAA